MIRWPELYTGNPLSGRYLRSVGKAQRAASVGTWGLCDGSQLADNPYNPKRDEFMRTYGYSMLRVWAHDAVQHMGIVSATILAALDRRLVGNVAVEGLCSA